MGEKCHLNSKLIEQGLSFEVLPYAFQSQILRLSCNQKLLFFSDTALPGVHCFQCNDVSSPLDCQNSVMCASGEVSVI